MKKTIITFVALLLLLPVAGHAGSAASRWDVRLGGYIKSDVVWTSQGLGVDNRLAERSSRGGVDVVIDKNDSLSWSGCETRLSWAMNGPDAGSGKTSAFVEADFRGSPSLYGNLRLRHAYMQLVWPKTSLLVGQTWQAWGRAPSPPVLAMGENAFNKGNPRFPQVSLTRSFSEYFTGVVAVQSPYSLSTADLSRLRQRAGDSWPEVVMDLSFSSTAYGKVGALAFRMGFSAFYGKDNYLVNEAPGTDALPHYQQEGIDRYGIGFYWYVPVIPERSGSKAGALAFAGQVFTGRGMHSYLPGYSAGAGARAYARVPGSAPSIVASGATTVYPGPVDLNYWPASGGWLGTTFYFTDRLFANALYGAQFNQVSRAFVEGQEDAAENTTSSLRLMPRRIQNFIVNVLYDVNPAIRLGIEYDYVTTAYAYPATPDIGNKGSFGSVRFASYYFF